MCRHVSMWGFQNPVCLSVPLEKKSPWFRQYQSYISNWYINGKVFTSTTPWKPKNLNIFSKKFEFWLLTKSWNHLSFVNISPTLVINMSMERSSQVLQHGNPKMWISKIKVANALKIRPWDGTLQGDCSRLLQCSSGARCPPWKQYLYLLPPNDFY